jgi:hypothetical protein
MWRKVGPQIGPAAALKTVGLLAEVFDNLRRLEEQEAAAK